jgi:DNA mismatch endonuclease (patch repair protein)
MARIRSRGNQSTELLMVRLLRKHGVRGWRRGSTLIGKPDFVFPIEKIAVFVDGDFWHGNPRNFRLPKSNIEYWTAKIHGNRRRDRAVNRILRAKGWSVIRIWQSSLSNEQKVISLLKQAIKMRKRPQKKCRNRPTNSGPRGSATNVAA